MAHFAELDNDNRVLRVIVIADKDTSDVNGVEDESIGIAFCKQLFGADTKWLQVSYNGNIRGIYPGEKDLYDSENDVFVPFARGVIESEEIIDAEIVQGELEAPVTTEPTEPTE
jgi:hypothetical protein